jgi:hypothetical protein
MGTPLVKTEKVAQFALEYLRGLNDAGVLGCLKHFPGHGNQCRFSFRITCLKR